MNLNRIAIIGGSGLEKLDIFQSFETMNPLTEYGYCSSPILMGKIAGKEVFFVSRHGFDHQITPTHVNNRAHIQALYDLNCEAIIATTACGSLRQEIKPGDLIFPNQVIDFTRFRKNTFFDTFENGNVQHIPFADPFNGELIGKLSQIARELNIPHHHHKTVVTIEGPRFSSRAESHMFRQWGADIINMSTAPEVILANERQIPYAAIAMSTDYDCWRQEEEAVSMEAVFKVFRENAGKVTSLLKAFLTSKN